MVEVGCASPHSDIYDAPDKLPSVPADMPLVSMSYQLTVVHTFKGLTILAAALYRNFW